MVEDPQKTRPTGMCRALYCAPTTTRHRSAPRTIVLPGTPRGERSGAPLPAQKEAAGARAAWSQTFPLPTHDHAARATLGRRDAIGVPAFQTAGVPG